MLKRFLVPNEEKKTLSRTDRYNQVLDFLREHQGEPLSINQIAEALELQPPYASALIAGLYDLRAISSKGKVGKLKYTVKHNGHIRERVRGRVKKIHQPKKRIDRGEVVQVDPKEYGGNHSIRVDLMKAIYEYALKHEGSFVTLTDIAEAVGTSQTQAYRTLKYLCDQGRVIKEPQGSSGSKLWIVRKDEAEEPTPVVEASKPVEETKSTNERTLYQLIESLSFEYIKETRSMDLLRFLEWVEKKDKE